MSKEHILRAMGQNYKNDQMIDELDRRVMVMAADEIKQLRLERNALRKSLEKMMNDEGLVLLMRPDQVRDNTILLELVNND